MKYIYLSPAVKKPELLAPCLAFVANYGGETVPDPQGGGFCIRVPWSAATERVVARALPSHARTIVDDETTNGDFLND